MERPSGQYIIEVTTGAWSESPKSLLGVLMTWGWKEVLPDGTVVLYQDQGAWGGSRKAEIARLYPLSWAYYDGTGKPGDPLPCAKMV